MYITENLSELNQFFKMSKNDIQYYESDDIFTEIFFLKGRYGISFDHDLKPVIKVRSGSEYSKGIYKDNQQNALKIYNQLKIEVKSLLEDDFELKF